MAKKKDEEVDFFVNKSSKDGLRDFKNLVKELHEYTHFCLCVCFFFSFFLFSVSTILLSRPTLIALVKKAETIAI